MGSITSNSWLVLSSSVHCVSVVPVAVYCRIEWYVSQPQAFRLTQLCALMFMAHSGGNESSLPYRCKIIYHTCMVRTYTYNH